MTGLMALALLAAAAVLLGLARAGRRRAPHAAVPGELTLPGVVRLGLWVPAPAALVRLAATRVAPGAADAAGLGDLLAPARLARAQAGAATAGLVAGGLVALAAPAVAPVAVAAAAAGWLLPARAVAARARERRRRILVQLPDLLDLLALCVESGMAVDPALRAAAGRLRGPLGEELTRVLDDIALGATRRAAYGDLSARLGLPAVTQTVAALLQADELGAPLSVALRSQAEALRDERARRAREAAARATPKIQLVVALVMVPAAMLLVLAVMLLELARQVGPVIGEIR